MLRTIFVCTILLIGGLLALRSAFNALLLYLWNAYFRPEEWVWTYIFYILPTSFVIGAYVVLRSLFAGVQFRFDLRVACFAALILLSTISTFASEHFTYSSSYLWDFIKTLVISYLISVLTTDLKRLRLVLLVICLSLSFEAAKQGWAQLVLNPGATNVNIVLFLGDNNGVAVGMLMLVPMLVALARTSTKRWERWLHHFLAVGVVYRAIATYSRGGFLASAALALVYAWRSPHRVRAIGAGALVAILTLSVMPPEFWQRMSTITTERTQNSETGEAVGRVHFWRMALLMVQDRPLTGVGVNAYTQAYPTYDTVAGAYGLRRSVHSAWLGALAELGIPGFLVFVTAIVLAFVACGRARRLAKRGLVSEQLGHYGTAIEAALLAFAVGGTFVIFQYVEMLWHAIGLSMAIHFLTQQELAARRSTYAAPVTPLTPRARLDQQPPRHVFDPQPRRPAVASLGRSRR
ncbi:MAG: O-antigen ligase family protein [Vicinamibacterales bacterium]